jgi:hypothetical protein
MGEDASNGRDQPIDVRLASPSALDFYILLAVAPGTRTADEIHADIVATSRQIVVPSRAQLTRALNGLARRGWLGAERPFDSFFRALMRRSYYLTSLGLCVARAEARAISGLLRTNPAIALLLGPCPMCDDDTTTQPPRCAERHSG